MKRDILEELAAGRITPDAAEAAYDAAMDADPAHWVEALTFSKIEATAFAQGVDFAELALWRKNGWPKQCAKCGRVIQPEKFGWWAAESSGGRHVLEHVKCRPQ